MGRPFTAILAEEWRGVISRNWNSERPLVFTHVFLTKTLGVRQAREIRARIPRRMDLWERGQHVGLVGDAEAEGAACEGRAAFSGEEEDDAVARSFYETVLSGNIRQAVHQATDREGGRCLLPEDKCTKPGDRLQRSFERSTRTCVSPPRKIPRAQTSMSMRMYQKQHLSTSRRMTSCGLHQSSPAQQVR